MKRSDFFKKLAVITAMAIPAGVVALGQKLDEEPTLVATNMIKMTLPDGSEYYVVGVNKDKLEEIPHSETNKGEIHNTTFSFEQNYFKKYKIKE